MEMKLFYGLFGSFFAVVIISVGILYLLFTPNPVSRLWQQTSSSFVTMIPDTNNTTIEEISGLTVSREVSRENKKDSTDSQGQSDEQEINGTPEQVTNSEPALIENYPNFQLDQLYRFINAHRQENRLSKLAVNLTLERSARTKLNDMIQDDYWQHENTAGQPTWQFFEDAGYQYSLAGENLSFNNNSAWKTFEGWMNSPTHNAQMLNAEYEEMGAAVDCSSIRDNNGSSCIVVLHLGKHK